MPHCPCGSGRDLDDCCGPLIAGAAAATAEALMRSRYTAFASGALSYLKETLAPEALSDYDPEDTARWVRESQFKGLEIRSTTAGGEADAEGSVEFVARYRFRGKELAHHERASFRRDAEGRWRYVDGEINPKPATRSVAKIGRNDPCPCGSGKKYKQCCGR